MKRTVHAFLFLMTIACLAPHAFAAVIGYWRFEEGTVGDPANTADAILDSTASFNHGTPTGDPIYSALTPASSVAQTGQANSLSLHFDGTDDVVTIGHNSTLGSAGPFTVEFWMRSPGTGPGQDLLIDKSHGFTDSTGWAFQSQPNNGLIFFGVGLGGVGNTNFEGVQTTNDLFDNQWHHLAGTYDGSSTEFFVDGVSQGAKSVGTYVGNTRDIRIGNTWQSSRFYAGQIDELRISDAVLSSDELLNTIPEPSIAALIGILGAIVVLRRTRRR